MRYPLFRRIVICVLAFILFTACRPKAHDSETVEQAMQKYDRYILHMDVDSISLLYAPDGELGKMAKGRDSIRKLTICGKRLPI